ncbi:2-keto-4-pentenoate hydratase [Salinicoccus halitifaciens]|nr:fumarylacetoacetate hydrolase family protein [Salinicoccus halitifaciens]MCD2137594.1 fumarylacetoacetate hydrolase family protein [Salinicoccus halitifaciens]
MDESIIKELSQYVLTAEEEKEEIIKITEALRPELNIDEAYMVQEELIRKKMEKGQKVIGPKMGITSEAKMKQMNVDNPIYGYVFDYMVTEDGGAVSAGNFIHPKVEPEIAFILSEDLQGPGITVDDVLEATEFILPALEIIDSRYENFNFTLPDVIADNTSAAGAVYGTDLTKPEDVDLDTVEVTLVINGEVQDAGTGAAILGHPANSIARLANMLGEKGRKVSAGERILAGAVTQAIPIKPGDHVVAKYGGEMGEVSFKVTD